MARRTSRQTPSDIDADEVIAPSEGGPALIQRGSKWPVSSGPKPFGNPPIETPDALPPEGINPSTGEPNTDNDGE